MIRIGILGATGYTALELIKILLRHSEIEITRLTTRDTDAPHLDAVHPSLRGQLDLHLTPFDMIDFASAVDFAFCCLPHAASAEVVGPLLDQGLKVVDFSADYRLNDLATFEKWYGVKHPDPARVGTVAYGVPELFREQIQSASLVANPGCFPSSAILPLAPLLRSGLLQMSPIIVDSKTGISGAGRKPNLKFHYPECNESISAYGVGTHRHMPEIDQIIGRFSGAEIHSVFTPHLTPMDRGILSTIYCQPVGDATPETLLHELKTFYADEPFVRITPELPTTKDVSGTNFCDITVRGCGNTIVILSVLDNLIKGASGAAVQNFNLMHGFDETLALV
jgi:N-acetyl-gamma-glutamyl-phosphate reductase